MTSGHAAMRKEEVKMTDASDHVTFVKPSSILCIKKYVCYFNSYPTSVNKTLQLVYKMFGDTDKR